MNLSADGEFQMTKMTKKWQKWHKMTKTTKMTGITKRQKNDKKCQKLQELMRIAKWWNCQNFCTPKIKKSGKVNLKTENWYFAQCVFQGGKGSNG